jgi:hypothetical protein
MQSIMHFSREILCRICMICCSSFDVNIFCMRLCRILPGISEEHFWFIMKHIAQFFCRKYEVNMEDIKGIFLRKVGGLSLQDVADKYFGRYY